MLDRKHAIVAAETKIGNEVSPVGLAVTVSDGAEYPRAVDLVAVVLCVKHAVLCGIVLVDLGVLGVNVVDSAGQLADSRNGVHTLPDKVRGIEVCADNVAYSRAELEESLGIVNAKSGVHLKCNANTVSFAELTGLFPIGDQLLVPLPIKDSKEVLGPGAGDPVGILGALAVTWTAGEGDHGVNAKLFGETALTRFFVFDIL